MKQRYELRFHPNCSSFFKVPWSVCPTDVSADKNCYEIGKEVPCSSYVNVTGTVFNCTNATQDSATQFWR